MTSPIIFHNLFDDDEPDLEIEDSLRVIAVPVLYSVDELFNMMAEFNIAAVHSDDTDSIRKRGEEDLERADHISDVEINKPVKKLRPSRPLKKRNATHGVSITVTSSQELNKKQDDPKPTNEENSDHREESAVETDGSKEITLKMGTRHVKPATAEDLAGEGIDINLGNVKKCYQSPIVIKQEKVLSDEKVFPLKQSTGISVKHSGDKMYNTDKAERKIPNVVKFKKEPGLVKTERLSLPSTVRVTLVKEEVTIDEKEEEKTNGIEAYNKALTSKIAEKEEFILSQQKIIDELGMKNEEINQKLSLREEFIDSQQKVIDDLEKQSINAHKVEKLENDLEEKEKIIAKLLESEEQWISKLQDSEKRTKNQKIFLEDLKQQLLMVKSDNMLQLTENNQLVDKCRHLEKEKKVLIEIGNSHRSTSEDILKTVEALKGKIDDVMTNDSREEELMSKITSLKKENSSLICLQRDLEEKMKSIVRNMDTKSDKNKSLEEALSEKIETNAQLEKEVSKLSEKLKDLKKNLDGKMSKVSKLEKENNKLKDKIKEFEMDFEAKSKEWTSLKRSLEVKTVEISSTEEGLERYKSKLTEMEERINLETGKSVELIKKLKFSEKLLFTKENDYIALKDQQLFLETKLRTSQRKVEEYEKDNIKFVEANLKVKCLEDEKRDLLKEIRKVSELQKKVKFMECKLKKYYNFYKKKTSQSEQQEDLDIASKSPNLEVMDIPDPKEIDEILNQISQDVSKHTESVAAEVSVKEISIPAQSINQTEIESTMLVSSEVNNEPQKGSCDTLKEKDNSEQSNTSLEDEDGLLNAWRSRMKQTHFSGYPAISSKHSDFATFSPKHKASTNDAPTKSYLRTDTSKESTVDIDDVVVISSRPSKKKQVSSDSDLDTEEDVESSRRRHKSKKDKKKKKKFKSKKDDKESERSRERKKHRSRRKSRSPTKSRSRSRSRSRNNRRRVQTEKRKSRSGSRSTSVHFREKIINISCSPDKGSKRARSPSPRKPLSQSSTSHASSTVRFQPRQKARSRSPAVVKEANFALSKEISSIIEKLQDAKSETAPNNPPLINETDPKLFKNATPATKDDEALTKVASSILPKNIVANYSSEFEEISDEEMTLAEDCLNEPDRTVLSIKENKSSLNEIPCFGLVPEINTSAVQEEEKILQEIKNDSKNDSKNELNTAIDVTISAEDISADVDHTLSVFWNLNCSCCGAKLTGSPTEDAQHYEEGECKKKSDWVKQGLPLICAYCTQSGSHWVAACPLLASFCFTCWTWGHSIYTHHEEEGEKSIVRLLASYNRFRLNHLANTGRSEQYKVFPSNSKVDGMWRFMGSMEDVETVSKKIPGHMGKPVGWLFQENWARLRGFNIKKEV